MRRAAPRAAARGLATLLAAALLAGSAGCGSDDGSTPQGATSAAGHCAAPRSGVDPSTGERYVDQQGTLADEKAWLLAWMERLYLWYREIPNVDPQASSTVTAYFKALLTPALTPSGHLKDQFSFTYPTADWIALSQSGVEAGYGIQWVLLSQYPPRSAVVAFVEPGSPADLQHVARGATVVSVDGVDLASSNDVTTLNAGMFPTTVGATHTLTFQEASGPRAVQLTSANVVSTPVPIVKAIGPVGYVLFNEHVATAEKPLIAAVSSLMAQGATDLVLDLRYNGGGYLDLASELAYMIAGPDQTTGKTFERSVFNDKAGSTNPVTGAPLLPTPFFPAAQGFGQVAQGTSLPSLGLKKLYVLTGPGTCSASESIVNGLRGVGVQVVQIGGSTCGKPYGFYPQDNCGTTFFAIELQGVNDQGFGDYADGFAPGGAGPAGLPGCVVADDYAHALGDPAEARLAAALAYRASGTCPAAQALTLGAAPGEEVVVMSPWRQNRIVTR